MTPNNKIKKTKLNKETLRKLADPSAVVGGMMNNTWTNCTHCECKTMLPGCTY